MARSGGVPDVRRQPSLLRFLHSAGVRPRHLIAIVALIPNIVASAVLTLVCRKSGLQDGYDETQPVSCTANP